MGEPTGRVRLLDVSDLPPPEPLERAVAALGTLGPGEALRLHHRREPCLLYPILDERGFAHLTRSVVDGEVDVWMWRAGDVAAEAAARAATQGE